MATDRTVVKGVAPDMTEAAFVAELRRVGSPVPEADARGVYRACAGKLMPSFLLGIFAAESGCGTNPAAICVGGGGVPEATRSWGNTTEDGGKPSYGGTGRVVRGRFSVYATWLAGGVSTVHRLCEYAPYVALRTPREIIPVFAPKSENDTEKYIAGVVATMTRLGKGVAVGHVPRPPIEDLIKQTTQNKVAGVGFDWGAKRKPGASFLHSMAGTLDSCINYFPGADVAALTDFGIGQLPWKGTPFARIVQFCDIYGTMIPWASGPVRVPEGDGPRFLARFGGAGAVNSVGVSIEHDDATWADGHVNTYRDANGVLRVNPNAPVTAAQWGATCWLQAWLHAEVFGQTADTYDWNLHHREICGSAYKTCPRERIADHTDAYQIVVRTIMRRFQEGVPYPKGGVAVAGLRVPLPDEGTIVAAIASGIDLNKPTPTGHTVAPQFHAAWTLEQDGYPLMPAVAYTDGKTRQVFENSMLEANRDGSGVRRGGIGQALMQMTGGKVPDWPAVHPLL